MQLIRINKALVLAAHPDDETLGTGGTIHKLTRQGVRVDLLTFTDGESAREDISVESRARLVPHVRDILGIDYYGNTFFPDNAMDSVPLLDICKFIERETKNVRYDLIFTHHSHCLNVDHTIVHKATMTVFRPNIFRGTILSYYIPSSSDYATDTPPPNVFVSLEQKDLNAKVQAAKVYDREMRNPPHSRSYANIINVAKMHGCTIGHTYAEGFRLERSIQCERF